jgi:hypothetical protein
LGVRIFLCWCQSYVGRGLAIDASTVQGILPKKGGRGRGLGPYSSSVLPYKKKNKLHCFHSNFTYDKNLWFNHVLENVMKMGGNWHEIKMELWEEREG